MSDADTRKFYPRDEVHEKPKPDEQYPGGYERPKRAHRFLPTERSLDIAEEIAQKLNMTMDRAETAQWATDLQARYYQDIAQVLGDEVCGHIQFEHLASRKLEAFSAQTKQGQAIVSFDQQLDSWLFSLNQLIGVRAFWGLSEDEYHHTAQLAQGVVATLQDPFLHEKVRLYIKPYLTEAPYPEALPVTNCMVMAMSAFVICHEIAHHTHGHIGKATNKQHEYEADQQGYKYFMQVIEAFDQTQYLKVSDNMLAAPCLLMDYFDFAERWYAQQQGLSHITESVSHPLSSKRRQALEQHYAHHWGEEAHNLYGGFQSSLTELMQQLGLHSGNASA